MRRYSFTDEWRLAADPAVVWEVVRNVEGWPTWWPSAVSVAKIEPGDERQMGAAWRFTFQTRLPYRMVFEAHTVREERMHGVDTTITGGATGTGSWGVRPVDGGSLVHFDWVVRPRRLWMRALSPLTRPVFIWNHQELMAEGGEALAKRLGVPLLSRPVGTPAMSSAFPETALSVVGLTALTFLVLRRLAGRQCGAAGDQAAEP